MNLYHEEKSSLAFYSFSFLPPFSTSDFSYFQQDRRMGKIGGSVKQRMLEGKSARHESHTIEGGYITGADILKMNFSVGVNMYSEKVTSYW